jgi:hypothetical protein
MHCIEFDLIEDAPYGLCGRVANSIGSDREKQARGMAFTHTREIYPAVVGAVGEVISFVGDHLGCVVVEVEPNRAVEQARHPTGIDLGLRSRRKDKRK